MPGHLSRRAAGLLALVALTAGFSWVMQGTGFNWPEPDHFRLVTLPDVAMLEEAIGRIAEFLATRR